MLRKENKEKSNYYIWIMNVILSVAITYYFLHLVQNDKYNGYFISNFSHFLILMALFLFVHTLIRDLM